MIIFFFLPEHRIHLGDFKFQLSFSKIRYGQGRHVRFRVRFNRFHVIRLGHLSAQADLFYFLIAHITNERSLIIHTSVECAINTYEAGTFGVAFGVGQCPAEMNRKLVGVNFFEQSGAPFAFVESKDADLVQCHRMQKRFHHVEHEREDFGS